MRNSISYRRIDCNSDPALDEVAKMFAELYEYVSDKGQQNLMVKDGEKLWIESVKRSLNKMSVIIIAEEKSKVIGFIHGIIRFLPDFLGGEKTGFIAHHYIGHNHRGIGVGRKLLGEVEKWLVSRGVMQSEAYVNIGNVNSKQYFEKNGYTHEIIQLRKFLSGKRS